MRPTRSPLSIRRRPGRRGRLLMIGAVLLMTSCASDQPTTAAPASPTPLPTPSSVTASPAPAEDGATPDPTAGTDQPASGASAGPTPSSGDESAAGGQASGGGSDDDPPDSTGVPPSTIVSLHGDLGPQGAVAPNDGTNGTAGSGCRPPGTDTLPDGVWMVIVTDFAADALTVDLICFRTVRSLGEAGIDRTIVDFEIRNSADIRRTLPLAADARFYLQTAPPVRSVEETTRLRAFGTVEGARGFAQATDPTPLGWLLVADGEAAEFYAPPLASA